MGIVVTQKGSIASHQAAKIANQQGNIVTLSDIVAVDVEQQFPFMAAPFVSKFLVNKKDLAGIPIGAQVRIVLEVVQPDTPAAPTTPKPAPKQPGPKSNPQRAKDRVAAKKEEPTKADA